MRFAIYKYRYISDKTFVCYKGTYEEACKEVDRLAREQEKPAKGIWDFLDKVGDKVYFTFLPEGEA